MKSRQISLAAILAAGALMLSACGGSPGLAALDRASTPEDALPADVEFSPEADPESVRLLATENGLKFFAAQDADHRNACLAVVPVEGSDGWTSSCGLLNSGGEIVNMSSAPLGITSILVGDGHAPELLENGGWTKVHKNVFIKRD